MNNIAQKSEWLKNSNYNKIYRPANDFTLITLLYTFSRVVLKYFINTLLSTTTYKR